MTCCGSPARWRQAEVPRANEFQVYVRWPWRWLRDSQSDWSEAAGFNLDWKGLMGFDRDRHHPDAGWLFRFDPGLPVLQAGDRCRVGIPPTVVHVFDVSSWYLGLVQTSEPPASLTVLVLPRGVPHDLGRDDLIDSLRPYEREPTRVELLFRPYPHLRDLDVAADRHGRRWAFCAPWWWVELDHDDTTAGLPAPVAGPAWTLTLLAGSAATSTTRSGLRGWPVRPRRGTTPATWPRGRGWRPPRPWDWNTRACRGRIRTSQWTIRTASAPMPARSSPA